MHEVSGNYYEVLGVQGEIVRAIPPFRRHAGSARGRVISDTFWEARICPVPGRDRTVNHAELYPRDHRRRQPQGFTGAASTFPSQTPEVIVALAKATLVTPASTGRNWLMDPARGRSSSWVAQNRV